MNLFLILISITFFNHPVSAHTDHLVTPTNKPELKIASLEDAISQIQFLGNASVTLANRPINLEIKNNEIVWLKKLNSNDEFSDYLNQGVAYIHVFHYIDALRSFKAARALSPYSLYPIIGQIFSYLGLSQDGYSFIDQLLFESDDLIAQASPRELLWFNLVKSIYKASGQPSLYVDTNLNSVEEAYENLVNFDPNDIETLTLATFSAGFFDNSDAFLKALTMNPNHTGANHYLVHYYEYLGRSADAISYAQRVAEYAPYNGHAVHMYGHVLPEVGQWKDARDKFIETDQIHKEWAKQNEAHPSEDWNYAHNLNLLAITNIALGDITEGKIHLSEACQFDSRACLHQISVTLIFSKLEQTEAEIAQLLKQNPTWKPYLQDVIDELSLLSGKSFSEISKESQKSMHLKMVNEIINKQFENSNSKKIWLESLSQHVKKSFPQHGFDSWTSGILNSLRLLAVAARTKDKETYDAILLSLKTKANEFEFDLYTDINSKK